ncbi:vWA domain-containing protein [Agromyces sp. G08B096]|uniref:VWA domain-containing protein n=1 Tax=Agromyces sp. G08B096 TaxID=3156399 RepID=A0AAU7W602_9MICO
MMRGLRRLGSSGLMGAGLVIAVVSMMSPTPAAASARAAVPPPTDTTAVVVVKTGADRAGTDGSVSPLAGVELGLFATVDAGDPVLTCTSDSEGDCSFVVEAASGLLGAQPWVRQIGVPTGWFANPTLRTGPGSGSGSVASPYTFQTPTLVAGSTYSSLSDFMRSSSNSLPTRSNGTWQQSRINPLLPDTCGLDIALVLDLSSSVGSNLPVLIGAADQLVDAFVGTPTRMSVFGFSATSPSIDRSTGVVYENHPELSSVSTTASADAFKAQYADWNLGSGTNWDQALYRVAEADADYDAAVVLTDGNPTRFGIDALHGDGSNTHFTDVEEAVFSANLLKREGTRVVSFGIGAGVSGLTSLNLAAISGPTAYDGTNVATADYFQIPTFEGAGDTLRQLALTSCGGSLSIVKQLVPEGNQGEDVTGAVPAGAGWEFAASSTAPGVGVQPPNATTSDDGTGAVSFEVQFSAVGDPATITVAETQHDGWTLVTQSGANALCTDLRTGDAVEATNTGAASFTVPFAPEAAVSCTLYNRPPFTGEVVVAKRWVIDGRSYEHGEQPQGLEAAATLSGPDGASPSPQPFGVGRDGYGRGETVTVDETTALELDGCSLVASRVTALDGERIDADLPFTAAIAGPVTEVELTNTVACDVIQTEPPTPSASPSPGGVSTLPATGTAPAGMLIAAGLLVVAGVAIRWARRPVAVRTGERGRT